MPLSSPVAVADVLPPTVAAPKGQSGLSARTIGIAAAGAAIGSAAIAAAVLYARRPEKPARPSGLPHDTE